MTHKLIFAVLTAVVCFNGSIFAETLKLSENGKTEYAIVLPDDAAAVEQTAAKELKLHLDAVTSGSFAIQKESETNENTPQILVGNTKLTKKLLPEIDAAKLPYDGIVIKTVGKNLVLSGHPQRGTLYAVNTFLEDVVGVRWWTSTESFIPKKPTLEIAEQNIQYAPKLIYREAYYTDAVNGVFASRIKNNGALLNIPAEYGGHHRFQYFVHSFYPLLPPDKYFKDHPEWYSEINGKRSHDRAQLCLTNEEMRKELTKNAIASLRANPNAKFISVSQNDWHGYCQCEKCKAVAEEEGSQSGLLIRFVNQVAEEIEKEFPDVWVETLAYQYTRKPPKLAKPRKNVVVRLCTIECSFVQPLSGEQNKPLRDDIEGWSKIADSLFVWDYTVNFSAYMLPHPNHRVLPPNVRFFVDHNTIGLFEQGDSWTTTGDFVRLKTWVLSQLMWNPSLDEKKLFEEFITGYYGAESAPFVQEYWKLLLDQVEKSGVYLGCYQHATSHWLDAATLVKAAETMDKAIQAAKDETYKTRLRRDKMPIDLALLQRYHELRRKNLLTGDSPVIPKNPLELLESFEARNKEFGNHCYNEGDRGEKLQSVIAGFREKFDSSVKTPPPDFCKDLLPEQWYDVQNFEFNLSSIGKWTFTVDDAKASNGKAVKMPGDHYEWATSYAFDGSVNDLKSPKTDAISKTDATSKTDAPPKYKIYAAVRCDAKTQDGAAMTLGISDPQTRSGVAGKTLNVSEISGTDYHWVELSGVPINSAHGQYLWFAPPKRPGEVDAVYIDRIVVVRE